MGFEANMLNKTLNVMKRPLCLPQIALPLVITFFLVLSLRISSFSFLFIYLFIFGDNDLTKL